MKDESEYEKLMRTNPWLMRWEWMKLWLSENLIWSWHPHRNRWCDVCGAFIGNSRAAAKAHKCVTPSPKQEPR